MEGNTGANTREKSCEKPPAVDAICKVIDGDTECPLQVYQLSRSSESTHFLCIRRDVALFDSTRAPDSF